MTGTESLKVEDALHGVNEAQTALKRAQQALARLEQRLTTEPASFAPLAQATLQLRDHLLADLATLEAGLAREPPLGNAPIIKPPEHDPDVSLGDVMALGGQ